MIMCRARSRAWPRRLVMLSCVLLLLTLLAIAVAVRSAERVKPSRTHLAVHRLPALPFAPRPIPEPMKVVALTPGQARASNSAVPILPLGAEAATPFIYNGSPQNRASAQSCLAAAVYYEAGDDFVGERAVAQVVLNRLRHPAFPKTICGVVFEGSERQTGCQFTFSCDGSLLRVPPIQAWTRANAISDAALTGFVDKAVGLATYYHADWVVPYWRDTLDKVAVVHSQIFYRWRGKWGRSTAFNGRAASPELPDPRIVTFAGPAETILTSADDDLTAPPRTSMSINGVPSAALKGAIIRLKDDDAGQYVLQLSPNASPGTFAVTAFTICAEKSDCFVFAWADEHDVPRALPVLPIAMRTMAFMYHKSSVFSDARPFWDCRRYARPLKNQCLPGTG